MLGPILDRVLVFDSYACRVNKGALAAVKRVQHHSRRYPWYVKIDIKGYFASIDQHILLTMLNRRFRDKDVLRLIERIIKHHEVTMGKGLPIGALTSQLFANYYLNDLDRLLLETCKVSGFCQVYG